MFYCDGLNFCCNSVCVSLRILAASQVAAWLPVFVFVCFIPARSFHVLDGAVLQAILVYILFNLMIGGFYNVSVCLFVCMCMCLKLCFNVSVCHTLIMGAHMYLCLNLCVNVSVCHNLIMGAHMYLCVCLYESMCQCVTIQ